MSKLIRWASAVLAAPSAMKTVHETGEIHDVRRGKSNYNTLDPNAMVGPGPLPVRNMTVYNNDPIERFIKKGGKRKTHRKRTHRKRTRKH